MSMSTRKRTIGRSKSADNYFLLPLQQQDVIETPWMPQQPRGRHLHNLFRSNSRRKLSPTRRSKPQHEEIFIFKNPAFLCFGVTSLLFGLWSITSIMRHPYVPTPELNHHHQPQHVYRENIEVKKRRKTAAEVPKKERNSVPEDDQDDGEKETTARERQDREKERRDAIAPADMQEKVVPKRLGQGNANDKADREMTPLERLRQKIEQESKLQKEKAAAPDTNNVKPPDMKQPANDAPPVVPVANTENEKQPAEAKKVDNDAREVDETAAVSAAQFVCPTQNSSDFHLHQPVVVLTQEHSGADALMELMAQNPHILVLSDLFSDDRHQVPLLVRLIDQLKQNCEIGDRHILYTPQQETFNQDIHALFASLMTESSGRDMYLELIQKFQNRFLKPWQWLAYIRQIPSVHTHFVFLLQKDDWSHFHMQLEAFLLELQEHDSAFVVIYRQHLLQTYAVQQRALLEEHSSDLPIEGKFVVEKESMENYFEKTRNYFSKIRSFLETKAPKQSLVLEYQRDLSNASELLSTYSKIQSLLQLPATQQQLSLPDVPLDVPLPDQILNWIQLRDEWGYSEEWADDLFGIQSIQNVSIDSSVTTKQVDSPAESVFEERGFICPTTEVNRHRPIFVFGTPRTGSNLVFNFLAMLGIVWPDADMLNLVELLSPQASSSLKLFALAQIIDHLKEKCQVGDRAMRYFPKYQDFQTPEDMFVSLMTEHSGSSLFQKLHDQFQKRLDDPMAIIRFLQGIPSPKQSYFALKVFPEHVEKSLQPVISQIPSDSVVIVLWRRNMLEAYVSLQIALSTNHWMNVEMTADDAITVDKIAFENYVQSTTLFYQQIKTAFAENNVTYTAFEYHADLSDTSRQEETIRHFQHLLQHKPDSKVTKEVMQGLWTTKQATVSLEQQIVNWHDIVEWGYNRPMEDWENLFP